MQKRAGLYVRVSTPHQEKEGYSIEAQTKKLEAYATAKDYHVVNVYTDAAFSGAKLERPALTEMIQDIEDGKLDVVVVYRLDRLARSQKHTMYLIEDVFLKNNVDFISLMEAFDTTSSFGRAMIGILSVFAQLERDNITERMSMGKLERVKKGLYMGGGNVPFGYRYHPETDELTVDLGEAAWIRRMYDYFLHHEAISGIVNKLKREFPTVPAYDKTIRRRIQSVYYIGKQKYGGKVYDAIHEPIISEEDFYKAQQMLCTRAPAVAFERSYMLSGISYCDKCGSRITGYNSVRKTDGKKYENRYYRCNARTTRFKKAHGYSCSLRNIPTQELENSVMELVSQYAADYAANKIKRQPETTSIAREISKLESQRAKVLDLYLRDTIPAEVLDERFEKIESDLAALRKQIESTRTTVDIAEIEEAVRVVNAGNVSDMADETKQRAIRTLVTRIDVRDDGAVCTFALAD